MVRKSYNSGSYIAYTYNAEGSLARLSYGDSTGELASYRFEYDSLGRLIRSAELGADGGTVQRTEHIYDGYNRLSRQSWTLGGKTYSESYVYNDPSDTNKNGDGALTQMTTATGAVIDYQYDTLRRLTRSEVSLNGSTVYTTAYAFRDLDASRTTTQVQYRNVRSANGTMLEGKKYAYDALGNITRISQSTKPFYTLVAYEYDAQNQLTKETYYDGEGTAEGNISRTISYTYDTAGNILSETRTEDGETTTKTYGYGDSEWADLLTEVDGQAITYDASGNPTSYFGRTMTWTNGRQLKTSTTHAFGAVLRSTYTYDADGIRKTKTIPINQRGLTCTYTFVTQNGKVVRQSWRTESIDFFYDESGRPFAMTYQRANDAPQTYYYVLNLQGDVVKLVDASGAEVASYEYDAWGNVLLQSGSMAGVNPLRYRGYYRDSETGFYYLHSRYYDPTNHRFINADVYASTGQGFVGTNMFAYCCNNPVNREDLTGQFWSEVWEFLKTAFTETGNAIETMAPAYAGCEAAAVADGPLPFGDIAAFIGATALTIGAVGCGFYQAVQTPNTSIAQDEEKSIAVAIPKDPSNPVIFPDNPNDFNPVGLVKVHRLGTKNGAIISWMDTVSNTEVFRWDENSTMPNGPHYHIYGTGHYYPGMIVPEPYASIYFPFR